MCVSFLKETSISEHDSFEVEVSQKFRNDPAGTFCKTGSAIIKFGRKIWKKSTRKDRRVIMNDMSISGNLLFELRTMSHNDKLTVEDFLKRENFEHLTNAIQNNASVMKKTLYWSVEGLECFDMPRRKASNLDTKWPELERKVVVEN